MINIKISKNRVEIKQNVNPVIFIVATHIKEHLNMKGVRNFQIKFGNDALNNDAFCIDRDFEVFRILGEFLNDLRTGKEPQLLRDINGNIASKLRWPIKRH